MTFLSSLLLPVFTLTIISLGAFAQSDASCLPYYDWTFNSAKKSPCEVASSLLAVCAGSPFPVKALPDNNHYVGPTLDSANPCQCSTAVYSLMSACGACQGRSYQSWSVWTANCPTVSTGFPEPIPSGLAIPGWAYLDVKALDKFDQSNARDHANSTETTAIPSPTSLQTSLSSTASITTTQSSSSTTSALPSPSSKPVEVNSDASSTTLSNHANAVGGGVIGAIFGAMLIAGVIGWFIHIRKRRQRQGEKLESPRDVENPPLPHVEEKKVPTISTTEGQQTEPAKSVAAKQSTVSSIGALGVPPPISSQSSVSSSVEFANPPGHRVY